MSTKSEWMEPLHEWLDTALEAVGDEGSNDDEYDALTELMEMWLEIGGDIEWLEAAESAIDDEGSNDEEHGVLIKGIEFVSDLLDVEVEW